MLYGFDEPPLTRDNALAAIRYIIAAVLFMGCVFFVSPPNNRAEVEAIANYPPITPPASSEARVMGGYGDRQVLPRDDGLRGQLDGIAVDWVMTIEDFIRMRARGVGVNEELALAIINCEGDRGLKGKMVPNAAGASSAFGPWQIINGTWAGAVKQMGLENADRSNYAVNIEVGMFILKTQGTNPWAASRHCWQR